MDLEFISMYVVKSWTRVLILVCVERVVDGPSSNNLTKMIMNALLKGGGGSDFFGQFIATFQDAKGASDYVVQLFWKIKVQNSQI